MAALVRHAASCQTKPSVRSRCRRYKTKPSASRRSQTALNFQQLHQTSFWNTIPFPIYVSFILCFPTRPGPGLEIDNESTASNREKYTLLLAILQHAVDEEDAIVRDDLTKDLSIPNQDNQDKALSPSKMPTPRTASKTNLRSALEEISKCSLRDASWQSECPWLSTKPFLRNADFLKWQNYHVAIARLQSVLGQMEAAETTWRLVVRESRGNFIWMDVLADHLFDMGKVSEAADIKAQALDLMDKHPLLGPDSSPALNARRKLARMFWHLRDYEKSEELLELLERLVENMDWQKCDKYHLGQRKERELNKEARQDFAMDELVEGLELLAGDCD